MVTIREWKKRGKKGFEVDVNVTLPDGTKLPRKRVKSPVSTRSGTERWARQVEATLIAEAGRKPKEEKKLAPTLAEFWPRFLDGYATANLQKASYVAERKSIDRNHFAGELESLRLDEITDEKIQQLKARLCKRSPKTVNNVLVTLSTVLKAAVEFGELERLPCRIRLLKTPKATVSFYEPEEYARLVAAASTVSPSAHLAILLGGDAGLRLGEMLALEWGDLDFARGLLRVERADWRGEVGLPKSGKPRVIPMTERLAEALRHRRGVGRARVVCCSDGSPLDRDRLKRLMSDVQAAAGLEATGRVHVLRHTFGARLAIEGAPPKAIQELMGHSDLTTTLRYMHLTPQGHEGRHSATRPGERSAWRRRGDEETPGPGS
jgi:integrase